MKTFALIGSLMIGAGVAAIAAALPRPGRSRLPRELLGDPRRPGALGQAADRLTGALDRHLVGTGRSVPLSLRLTRAGVASGPGEFLLTVACLSFVAACAVAVVTGSLLGGVLAGAGTAVGSHAWVSRRGRKRVAQFETELPEALDLLAGSLEAGTPIAQAMELVAAEGRPPLNEEFARVLADHRLGAPLAEALESSAGRIGSSEYAWCVRAVRAQQEFGASLADLLRTLGEFMRWRQEIRGEVRALTAEGRLSGYILTGLPIAMVAFLLVSDPSYLTLLVTRPIGIVMTGVAVGLMSVGALWMRRIVNLEV